MTDSDRHDFAELLTATMQVYGATLSATAIGIWWGALARHGIENVRAALSAHVQDPERGRFAPKPADVIAQIVAMDGRPGADEAWALCPLDEGRTTVWTDEISRAFFAGAYQILADGDRIAARMAFKDAYEREVSAARRMGAPVTWSVSLGHDVGGRSQVLLDAMERGRIGAPQVAGLLPSLDIPQALRPVLELLKSA